MNPILQLDPATLTLWFDPELIGQAPEGPKVSELVFRAIMGEDVTHDILALEDPQIAGRAANLVSCVWHEKRHFVDLLLWNYGAFRLRQFHSIYLNALHLLSECYQGQHVLVCPLDAACDAFRMSMLGVSSVGENALGQARNIRDRKRMLATDRKPIQTRWLGPVEVGGEAQLEALAYLTQTVALNDLLGVRSLESAHADIGDIERLNGKYRWILFLLNGVGAMPTPTDLGNNRFAVNGNLVSALLMAALTCRVWGQTQSSVREGASSHLPSQRLTGLLQEFAGKGGDFEDISAADSWDLVNRTSRKLWGRTVMEELDRDFEYESSFVRKFQDADYQVTDSAIECLQDLHGLRGRLIESLRSHPASFVDVSAFVANVLPEAGPIPILARPSGGAGQPGSGWERVIGYREEQTSSKVTTNWWWAATPADAPPGKIRLTQRVHWLNLVSELAPMAKLLMNGFMHRTMLGPELWHGRTRLTLSGVNFKIDPMFQFPADSSDPTFFWQQSKRTHAVCDLCRAPIARMQGRILSPWILRQSESNAKLAMDMLGGGEVGKYRFWQDWSVWLICDDCEYKYVKRA